MGDFGDPVSTVSAAIKGLDSLMNAASPFSSNGTEGSSPQQVSRENSYYEPDVPDAVSRGFVTVDEAQQLFDLYVQSIICLYKSLLADGIRTATFNAAYTGHLPWSSTTTETCTTSDDVPPFSSTPSSLSLPTSATYPKEKLALENTMR